MPSSTPAPHDSVLGAAWRTARRSRLRIATALAAPSTTLIHFLLYCAFATGWSAVGDSGETEFAVALAAAAFGGVVAAINAFMGAPAWCTAPELVVLAAGVATAGCPASVATARDALRLIGVTALAVAACETGLLYRQLTLVTVTARSRRRSVLDGTEVASSLSATARARSLPLMGVGASSSSGSSRSSGPDMTSVLHGAGAVLLRGLGVTVILTILLDELLSSEQFMSVRGTNPISRGARAALVTGLWIVCASCVTSYVMRQHLWTRLALPVLLLADAVESLGAPTSGDVVTGRRLVAHSLIETHDMDRASATRLRYYDPYTVCGLLPSFLPSLTALCSTPRRVLRRAFAFFARALCRSYASGSVHPFRRGATATNSGIDEGSAVIVGDGDESPLLDDGSRVHVEAMSETETLRRNIRRIWRLVQLGFGEAGHSIISRFINIDGEVRSHSTRGFRVHAIFGMADIRSFTELTECFQEDVLSFVNDVAAIIHTEIYLSGGAPNKNMGDAFLVGYKLPTQPLENNVRSPHKQATATASAFAASHTKSGLPFPTFACSGGGVGGSGSGIARKSATGDSMPHLPLGEEVPVPPRHRGSVLSIPCTTRDPSSRSSFTADTRRSPSRRKESIESTGITSVDSRQSGVGVPSTRVGGAVHPLSSLAESPKEMTMPAGTSNTFLPPASLPSSRTMSEAASGIVAGAHAADVVVGSGEGAEGHADAGMMSEEGAEGRPHHHAVSGGGGRYVYLSAAERAGKVGAMPERRFSVAGQGIVTEWRRSRDVLGGGDIREAVSSHSSGVSSRRDSCDDRKPSESRETARWPSNSSGASHVSAESMVASNQDGPLTVRGSVRHIPPLPLRAFAGGHPLDVEAPVPFHSSRLGFMDLRRDFKQLKGVTVLANNALAAFVNIVVMLHAANEPGGRLHRYLRNPSLRASSLWRNNSSSAGGFRVRVGCGLHLGWAVEGAIGTSIKIDASYLSPAVNVTARLETATKFYNVDLLISSTFAQCLSFDVLALLRRVDCVKLKGVEEPLELFTINYDLKSALDLLNEGEVLEGRSGGGLGGFVGSWEQRADTNFDTRPIHSGVGSPEAVEEVEVGTEGEGLSSFRREAAEVPASPPLRAVSSSRIASESFAGLDEGVLEGSGAPRVMHRFKGEGIRYLAPVLTEGEARQMAYAGDSGPAFPSRLRTRTETVNGLSSSYHTGGGDAAAAAIDHDGFATAAEQVSDFAFLQKPDVFPHDFIDLANAAVDTYLGEYTRTGECRVPAAWHLARMFATRALEMRPTDGPLLAILRVIDAAAVRDEDTGLMRAPPSWAGYRVLDDK